MSWFPMMAGALLAQAAPASPPGRVTDSPIAWTLAGLLGLVALYLLIRLLEWDSMNRETPGQEDPFLD